MARERELSRKHALDVVRGAGTDAGHTGARPNGHGSGGGGDDGSGTGGGVSCGLESMEDLQYLGECPVCLHNLHVVFNNVGQMMTDRCVSAQI